MSELIQDLKSSSRDDIISTIGESVWKAFDSLTQTGVLTAELCLRAFAGSPGDVDFSASVVPIMKALENELIRNFYSLYVDFLKRKYPDPDDYVLVNDLTSLDQLPQDARRKILGHNSKQNKYWYRNPYDKRKKKIEFTIGDFQYTVGVDDLASVKCDTTAVEFYKDKFFGTTADDSHVVAWICNLTQNLEGLRQLRNDSAHAGKTQTLQNAEDAMNVIIKVDHVLMMVSNPSLP